jgi:hypothetical protein
MDYLATIWRTERSGVEPWPRNNSNPAADLFMELRVEGVVLDEPEPLRM